MIKKVLILALFFYFFVLLQSSFFIHFFQFFPNLALIAVIAINLFESPKSSFGIFFAVWSGFLFDIFSENFIGFWILILFSISLFIKLIIKSYVSSDMRSSLRQKGMRLPMENNFYR